MRRVNSGAKYLIELIDSESDPFMAFCSVFITTVPGSIGFGLSVLSTIVPANENIFSCPDLPPAPLPSLPSVTI